jgi:ubiquinone/menaquinone biosynthesis C-methylase UbiE
MQNSLAARDPALVTHETYISGNPVIRVCLRRFLNRVAGLFAHIRAPGLYGLDVGCGEGHMLGDLHQRGLLGRMVAVDLDPTRIAFAHTRYPFCAYQTGDVHQLDFADGTFDYLLAAEVLEHLPDPRRALQELRRVVKPGGYLIVSVPHEPFFHWGNLARGKYWDRGGRTPDHLNFWRRREFERLLSEFMKIEKRFTAATFPWLLYLGKFHQAG